jgi:putrescine transport system ATP-binding protein
VRRNRRVLFWCQAFLYLPQFGVLPDSAQSSAPLSDLDASHIVLDDVNKSFGAVQALRGISLDIRRGELFSLLGTSGCGKSTLLRALAGFVTCDSGRIAIGGRDVTRLPPHQRPVNMMFQSYGLFPHMTVEGNIAFGLKREGVNGDELRRRVGEALDLIKMPSFRRRMPHQLSGGQRQRVALARAIVKQPKVLLLDEPLSALDKKLRGSTRQELTGIQQQLGITFVMVTHDQEEALTMSTRMAVMSDGVIVQVGTPEEVYERPATRYVADFIGSVNLFDATIVDLSAETATLECAALARNLQATNHGHHLGAKVTLAVRPEHIAISAPPDPRAETDIEASGTIVGVAYTGDRRIYQVALESGPVIQVSQSIQRAAATGLPPGTAVRVGWDAHASILVGR